MSDIRQPLWGDSARHVGAALARQVKPIDALDVPLPTVEAEARLQQLLAQPPAGHTAIPQPAAWYEAVFDLLACTHPDTCTCTPEEGDR